MSSAGLQAAEIHVPSDYRTIHEAVERALPGDTIIVSEGKYKENININKQLAVKAEKGREVTIIQASVVKEPVFRVSDTEGVSISGFTATGSMNAGIALRNAKNCSISDNRTINNGVGIYLHSVSNSRLAGNIANENELYGIYLEASSENTFEKNIVEANKDKGIYLNSSNNNSLNGNSVKLNVWNGIILWLSNNNTVRDNKVFRNGYGIVVAESNDNILINNSNWPNFYLILPMVLAYIAILLFFIERKIFSLLEK